eukprot:6393766-Ditylum_brightwellii.AAC.1
MAIVPKANRNTDPIEKLAKFGNVFHYDIVYRTGAAIGSYCYALWPMDRHSHIIKEYPLCSMEKTKLLTAFKKFIRDIEGRVPRQLIANCDFKLIGGRVAEFLQGIQSDPQQVEMNLGQAFILSAPAGHQNQNGLAEIKLRRIMAMV